MDERPGKLRLDGGIEDDARVRIYSVHPEAFRPVQHWLAEAEELWRAQLNAFKEYAESSRHSCKPKK